MSSSYVTPETDRAAVLALSREILAAVHLNIATRRAACLARREVLSWALARPASSTVERGAGDELRGEISAALDALAKRIIDDLKTSWGSEGRLQTNLAFFLEGLDETDLEHESGQRSIRLTIKKAAQNALLSLVRELIAAEVATIVADINAALDSLDEVVARAWVRWPGSHCGPLGARVAESPILDKLGGLLQIAVKYQGTLARPGFFHRWVKGRRSIFTERLDEELEKARDHLQLEVQRVLSDVLRALQATVAETIERQKRSMSGKLDERFRECAARAQREAQEAREAGQLALKQLELKERQSREPLQTLAKLDREIALLSQQMSA